MIPLARRLALASVPLAGLVAGCAQLPAGLGPGSGQAPGWSRAADAPLSGRTDAVVAGVGDELVVVGGWEFLCPPNAHCAFPETPLLADGAVLDTTTGEWREMAAAPYGLRSSASAVVGSAVYVLTGCATGPGCDGPLQLLRYDTDADRWDELAMLPGRHSGTGLVPVGDDLLALSGTDEQGERPDHLYDVATDSWEELPDDPMVSSYDRFAVADGHRVLVLGSPRGGGSESKVGAAYDLRTGRWTSLPRAPGPGYQVWRAGDEAWLNPHFGRSGGGVLDLATDSWRDFPSGPGAGWEGDLAGILAEGSATYEYASGWVRDTRDGTWVRVPDRPGQAYDASLTAVGEALVVFGGQEWSGGEGALVSETWLWRPPA